MKEFLLILGIANILGVIWQIKRIRLADQIIDEAVELRESAHCLRCTAELLLADVIDEQTRPLSLIFHPEKTFGKN